MKTKLTLLQINRIVRDADKLFSKSARAWERGSSSGNSDKMKQCTKLENKYAAEAEALLTPFKIKIDYPGLYPSFEVCGVVYYTTESAVSAALEY